MALSTTSADLDAPRILLVEQDPADVRRVLEIVEHASSGRARLRVATRLDVARAELIEHGTDCVLLSLDLPDSLGLDTVGGINLAAPWAPIVVLSNPGDETVARRALEHGAQEHLVKGVADGPEVMRSVRYAIERKRVENELAHQARHDPLTGLPNRILFGERVERALAHLWDQPGYVAAILLDLDRFKVVNDGLGHDAGDALLVEVAHRLTQVLRGRDAVARLGGDEFLVLCDEVDSEREVFDLAEGLQQSLAPPIPVAGTEVVVTASVGIAATCDPGISAEGLLRDADIAMHRAKASGPAAVELFDGEMHRRIKERLGLEHDLRRGLAEQELVAHFQPVVDLTSGAAVGAEALVRWRRCGELVGPGEFIDVAEETGLVVALGREILEQACRRAASWGAERRPYATTMSVNLSAAQLADTELVGNVRDAVERHSLDPGRLWFEITEQAIIDDEPSILATLHELKDLGVRICLDDFGTGYSSLTHLTRFPLDGVKIDRSFVSGLGISNTDRAIVRAVIALANELDLTVVAEGIETREQADELHALGCGLAQGYAFGRPVPADELPNVA